MGVATWLWSLPRAVWMLLSGRVRFHHERLGTRVHTADDRTFTIFGETVSDPVAWLRAVPPAVLQIRFRLRGMSADHRVRHAAFRRLCFGTTPGFVALAGFRSKLWLVDPATGEYAGLYEWDDARTAGEYACALRRVLRPLCEGGSVAVEIVDGTTIGHYLAAATAAAPIDTSL
jgi:hypothetical protein